MTHVHEQVQGMDVSGPWSGFDWPLPIREGTDAPTEAQGTNEARHPQQRTAEASEVVRFTARDDWPNQRPPTHSSSIDLNRRTAARSVSRGDRSGNMAPSEAMESPLNPSRHMTHFPSGSHTSPLQSPGNLGASLEQLNTLLQQWINAQHMGPNQGAQSSPINRRVTV